MGFLRAAGPQSEGSRTAWTHRRLGPRLGAGRVWRLFLLLAWEGDGFSLLATVTRSLVLVWAPVLTEARVSRS